MSQENVDAMRRGLEAWRRGDVKTVGALMDEFVAPEFEIEPLYFDGSYRGHEGLWQLWSDLEDLWTSTGWRSANCWTWETTCWRPAA